MTTILRTITAAQFCADLNAHELGYWQVDVFRNGELVQQVAFATADLGNEFMDALIAHSFDIYSGTDRWIPCPF